MSKITNFEEFLDAYENEINDCASNFIKKVKNGTIFDFQGFRPLTRSEIDILFSSFISKIDDLICFPHSSIETSHQIINMCDETINVILDWAESKKENQNTHYYDLPVATETPMVDPFLVINTPSSSNQIKQPDQQYTPTKLSKTLKEKLISYIESSYPLVNHHLIEERSRLLRNQFEGKLLAQEPYIETTPKYKSSQKSYKDLNIPQHIANFFETLSKTPKTHKPTETIIFNKMYTHQTDAIETYLNINPADRKNLVVATGTGSGKTECFMLPILGSLFDEASKRPDSFQHRAMRVMILYPLNALVNDQLTRLRQLFGDVELSNLFKKMSKSENTSTETPNRHPVFGMYTGRTPYPGPKDLAPTTKFYTNKNESRLEEILNYYENLDQYPALLSTLKEKGRYPAKDMKSFYAKHKEIKNQYNVVTDKKWDQRLLTHPSDRELFTRQEMINYPNSQDAKGPDIFITNYSMLEYILLRPFEKSLFEETKEWLKQDTNNEFILVLDEAHMYQGTQGSEVAFLIRRLQHRLGLTDPDKQKKFKVICTSASLGSSTKKTDDTQNASSMHQFIADLTNQTLDQIKVIEGQRELLDHKESGSEDLASMLAQININHLIDHSVYHEDISDDEKTQQLAIWKTELKDFFTYFSKVTELQTIKSFEQILALLYETLHQHPVVNLLLHESSSKACSISQLSNTLFPNHEHALVATENLLNLGNIAKKSSDSTSLIPTRIHLFFKGLAGLYACINPLCQGKIESHRNTKTDLGKIFSEPRMFCDDCNSRVLEISSCRECGNAYLNAYLTSSSYSTHLQNAILTNLDFIYGEIPGQPQKIELLTKEPLFSAVCDEILINIKTGQITTIPSTSTRSLWIYVKNHQQLALFEQCACCQNPDHQASAKIRNFQTKGELAFTSLIETQFAEQPPQKNDITLPNKGKKVLIFSDGRQKAARLAPALEEIHNKDLFRQLIILATKEYENDTHTKINIEHALPQYIMFLCVKYNLILNTKWNDWNVKFNEIKRNLAASSKSSNFDALIKKEITKISPFPIQYLEMLFTSLTDRYYSLSALGFASIQLPISIIKSLPSYQKVLQHMSEDKLLEIFKIWIKILLERKAFSKSYEVYIQDKRGFDLNDVKKVFPLKFMDFILKIYDQNVLSIIQDILKESCLSNHFYCDSRDNSYFLVNAEIHLNQNNQYYLCESCGRLHIESLNLFPKLICPACCSEKIVIPHQSYIDGRLGYFQNQIKKLDSHAPFGMITAEHSAQLSFDSYDKVMNKTEEYELRFQDIPMFSAKNQDIINKLPIDVLSCTTTMEVGIDIGSLAAVALRNTPPLVSNYQQRAGRAGRRGHSVASVLTYAQDSAHDIYFFHNPEKIISGEVRSPMIYIENQDILIRHIYAYYLQDFFKDFHTSSKNKHILVKAFGTIYDFIHPKTTHSFSKLKSLLTNTNYLNTAKIEIKKWVPYSSHLRTVNHNIVDRTIDNASQNLINQLDKELKFIFDLQNNQTTDLDKAAYEEIISRELLEFLSEKAILPRYAFPLDVINFHVFSGKKPIKNKPTQHIIHQTDRDLQIALSEFAPGNQLTIDKMRYTSNSVYDMFTPNLKQIFNSKKNYFECLKCNYITTDIQNVTLQKCPKCQDPIVCNIMVTPPGFGADVNIPAKHDVGQQSTNVGQVSRARLVIDRLPTQWQNSHYSSITTCAEPKKQLLIVNKSVDENGFVMCTACGRIEPKQLPHGFKSNLFKNNQPVAHLSPLIFKESCTNISYEYDFLLGHQFPTDVLLVKLNFDPKIFVSTIPNTSVPAKAVDVALTTLSEVLSLASARVLQVDASELAAYYISAINTSNHEAYLYLYDLLPGGAGYTIEIQKHFQVIIETAQDILTKCSCDTSCYSCLRNYNNKYYHLSFNRILALDLLNSLIDSQKPLLTISNTLKEQSLNLICEYLKLKNISYTKNTKLADGTEVDLSFDNKNIILVHPLLSPIEKEKIKKQQPDIYLLDWYSLIYDLANALQIVNI